MVATHATKQCLDFTNSEEMVFDKGLAGYPSEKACFSVFGVQEWNDDLFL
jgi:hypothetical protein